MLRLLHPRNKRFGIRKNHRLVRIVAGELLHIIHGIKAKQRNEFHFIAIFMNEQFRAAIAANFSSGNARKNFIAKHFFICCSVCTFSPPVPNASDHMSLRTACRARPQLARRGGCSPFPCVDYEQEHEQENRKKRSHTHYLIAAIDVDGLSGYRRSAIAGKKNSGRA